MATTQLLLYNHALMLCGERSLSSTSEERESRRLLDHVWDNDGVKGCLEAADWKFAMRTSQMDYDALIDTEFGYEYAFGKPTDWVRTTDISADEYFNTPLTRYADENNNWYADVQTFYVRYISDDAAYGNDLTLWTSRFGDYVAAAFAAKIIHKLTSDENKQASMYKLEQMMLKRAAALDAISGPTVFPPQGSWNSARSGNRSRERGNRGSLTG